MADEAQSTAAQLGDVIDPNLLDSTIPVLKRERSTSAGDDMEKKLRLTGEANPDDNRKTPSSEAVAPQVAVADATDSTGPVEESDSKQALNDQRFHEIANEVNAYLEHSSANNETLAQIDRLVRLYQLTSRSEDIQGVLREFQRHGLLTHLQEIVSVLDSRLETNPVLPATPQEGEINDHEHGNGQDQSNGRELKEWENRPDDDHGTEDRDVKVGKEGSTLAHQCDRCGHVVKARRDFNRHMYQRCEERANFTLNLELKDSDSPGELREPRESSYTRNKAGKIWWHGKTPNGAQFYGPVVPCGKKLPRHTIGFPCDKIVRGREAIQTEAEVDDENAAEERSSDEEEEDSAYEDDAALDLEVTEENMDT